MARRRQGREARRCPGRRGGFLGMEVLTLLIQEGLDVLDATFARPELTTFCRLDELSSLVVGQQLEPDRVVLACRVFEPDKWWRGCGCEGSPRDSVTRELAHEPLGWRPTTLWSPAAATASTTAGTCGGRIPAAPPNRGRSCFAGRCAGRWTDWWSSTSPSPESRRAWRCLAYHQRRRPTEGKRGPHRQPEPLRWRQG